MKSQSFLRNYTD